MKNSINDEYLQSINEEPEIPDELIDAYSKGELAVFLGAGVSRLMGCMGWDEMSKKLIEEVCKPSIAHQINESNLSSKAKITIAYHSVEKNTKGLAKFWSVFNDAISPDASCSDVYDTISKLDTLFITTNCDGLLRKHFPSRYSTVCTPQNYDDHKNETFLFCLHGDYGKGLQEDKETLVFTEDQYLSRYHYDTPHVTFIRRLMVEKRILFIGYGLSEFEILKEAFSPNKEGKCNHFLLEGFYEYQDEYYNTLKRYYECLGIKLIRYSKDNNGYSQLKNVIEKWIIDFQKRTPYISKAIDSIVESLKEVNCKNRDTIYHEIDRNDELGTAYFTAMLQALPVVDTCYKWIKVLIEDKKIQTDDIPRIRETNDGYMWNDWDVFDCILECLRSRAILNEDRKILVQFVRECMCYVLKDEKILKNGAVIEQIGEIFFELRIIPIEDDWIFIETWNEYSVDGGYQIYVKLLEWILSLDEAVATRIIGLLYRKVDNHQSDRSYWFEKFSKILAEKENQNILFNVITLCTASLIDETKESTFYSGYEDRFHMATYSFESHMAKSISIMLAKLCEEKRKEYFKEQLQKCNGTSGYQLIINYAKECNVNVTGYFQGNPLNIYNTFVDFYLWAKKMSGEEHNLSKNDRLIIGKWVKEARFGYNNAEQKHWKEIIRNKINAYRYYLLKMINYENEYDQDLLRIEEAGFANIKMPDEAIEEYYTFRDIPPERYFDSIDFAVMTDEDIFNTYIGEIMKRHGQNLMFFVREMSDALFNHISNVQLENFVARCIESGKDVFSFVSLSIHSESTIHRISKSSLKKILEKWRTLIYSCNIKDEGLLNLIRDYVYFLQGLRYSDMSKEEILTHLLEVDVTMLFGEEMEYNEHMDVIMNIINTSESQYYSLVFEYAALCKDNNVLSTSFKKWFNKVTKQTESKWFSLSCAYGIQNLLLVDMNQVKTVVLPYLSCYEKQSYICISIACGMNSVVEDIVNYISEGNRIEEVLEVMATPSEEFRYAGKYINYVVTAYCYGILNPEVYERFIRRLPKQEIHHAIWTIVLAIKGLNKRKKIKIIKETISFLNEESKGIACVELFNDVSRIDNIDSDWWTLLSSASTWSKTGNRIWTLVEECLRRTKRKNKKITTVINWLEDSSVVPYDITLKRILYLLVKLGLEKEGSDIAYFAVKNNITPTFFGKYIPEPKDILDDMNEDD